MASSHEELIQSFQTARSYIRSFLSMAISVVQIFLKTKIKITSRRKVMQSPALPMPTICVELTTG